MSAMTFTCARAILAAILLSASTACGSSSPPAEETKPAPPSDATTVVFTADQVRHGGVRWAAASSEAVGRRTELPGRLVPNDDRTTRISAPLQARVVTVHVKLGDRVAAKQPLVSLRSPEAASTRADEAKAIAELNSRDAAVNYAKHARERAERLLELKAIAAQDVERARTDEQLADAARNQAQAELDRTRAILHDYGAEGASGDVVLRAPAAGVVVARDAVPGAVVEAGALLVTVTDASSLWLEIAATESAAPLVKPGQRIVFTVRAFSDAPFDAEIQSVGAALDPETRTLPVRAAVSAAGGKLKPGMFATVSIEGTPATLVTVPDAAVQLLAQKPVVFVARPDGNGGAVFTRRDVEIASSQAGRTALLKGVAPGEQIVVDGAFAVKSEFARGKMAAG
jgi:cobalt-zinc-cadmium efflux system membrane fusion protein